MGARVRRVRCHLNPRNRSQRVSVDSPCSGQGTPSQRASSHGSGAVDGRRALGSSSKRSALVRGIAGPPRQCPMPRAGTARYVLPRDGECGSASRYASAQRAESGRFADAEGRGARHAACSVTLHVEDLDMLHRARARGVAGWRGGACRGGRGQGRARAGAHDGSRRAARARSVRRSGRERHGLRPARVACRVGSRPAVWPSPLARHVPASPRRGRGGGALARVAPRAGCGSYADRRHARRVCAGVPRRRHHAALGRGSRGPRR